MRFVRSLIARVRPTDAFPIVLELVAFGIAVATVWHFLGFWWALPTAGFFLILIALALDTKE